MQNDKNYKIGELAKRCANGERKAQNEIFRHFFPLMKKVCCSICSCQEDVEDALMIGFEKAFRYMHKFRGENASEMYGWLKTIIRNQAIDTKKNHEVKTPPVSVMAEGSVDITTYQNPSAKLDLAVITETIGTKLPEKMSAALSARAIDGLSYSEAADRIGVTEDNARVLVTRARAKLAEYHPEYKRLSRKR